MGFEFLVYILRFFFYTDIYLCFLYSANINVFTRRFFLNFVASCYIISAKMYAPYSESSYWVFESLVFYINLYF